MAAVPEVVISVAELDRRLGRAVAGVTGAEWVEGEVGSLRRAASGHLYFVLKDDKEDATIDCVMYRFQAQRARQHCVEGARIHVLGRAALWAPRGRLQLVAERVRPAGRGALLEALERLKRKLGEEGLFDPERKRPLPEDPRIVGVVTSAHGAALHDIITVAFRRGRVRIVLSPALVQGEQAPQSIVTAIDRLERYPGLDVLIVGRGGGSAEDLMAFNDERVVRRVARVGVPVVSAVGHEVDTTLTDLVADVRAATPSQAAEVVVADRAERLRQLEQASARLSRAMRARMTEDSALLARLRAHLGDPRFAIAQEQQLLDDLLLRLERLTQRRLGRARASVDGLYPRLLARHPRAVVARARGALGPLSLRLSASGRVGLRTARSQLSDLAGRLDALSPLAVLSRGYAIAQTEEGSVLRSAADARIGQPLTIRLHRGQVGANVTALEPGSPTPAVSREPRR